MIDKYAHTPSLGERVRARREILQEDLAVWRETAGNGNPGPAEKGTVQGRQTLTGRKFARKTPENPHVRWTCSSCSSQALLLLALDEASIH